MSFQILIIFAAVHEEFRFQELDSVCKMFDIPIEYTPDTSTCFVFANVSSITDAKRIASRCILIKEMILPWAWSNNTEELHHQVKKFKYPENYKTDSFKVSIQAFNHSIENNAKLQIINSFAYLGFQGKIDLKNPDFTLSYWQEWTKPEDGKGEYVMTYFGTLIATGQRNVIERYNLKKRQYLGITSMDAELSLIMANQAQVRPGSLVYDPCKC